MRDFAWHWDRSLYAGSAPHYVRGRLPYPSGLVEALRAELDLDGTGRLLDVGCGPGSLTLSLAPLFDAAVGVDADADMLAEADRAAVARGLHTVVWRQLRAEDLPADLGTFRVVTFAQAFHWMDQPLVARRVRGMLADGGSWVHVSATTHRGSAADERSAHPQPPWQHIDELVAAYLGPVRRAGRGVLPQGTRSGEEDVMRDAGYAGPRRLDIHWGDIVTRRVDDVVDAVFSLSGSAPHLFGDRRRQFEGDLRELLVTASPSGLFAERTADVGVVIWRA